MEIKTPREYKAALRQYRQMLLALPQCDTPEWDEFRALSNALLIYECKHFPEYPAPAAPLDEAIATWRALPWWRRLWEWLR